MNIILVSKRLAKARTITLGLPQFMLLGLGMVVSVLALASAINYVMLRFAAELNVPYLQTILLSAQQEQHAKTESYLRENLNAMAVRLGQMQAQLVRLDTLGERLAKLAGFKPQDLVFSELPARGGATMRPRWPLPIGAIKSMTRMLTSPSFRSSRSRPSG